MGKELIQNAVYLRWPIVAVLVLFSIGTGALLDLSLPTVVFVLWVAAVSVLLGALEKRGPGPDPTNRNMVVSAMVLALVVTVFRTPDIA